MNEYPKWKVVTWRFVRVFIASFVVVFSQYLINLQGLPTLEGIGKVAIIPAFIAGINALGKALREYFENGEEVMKNIPF